MCRFSELTAAIQSEWPCRAWRDVNVVVAVSGGADSVALLLALARLCEEGRGRLIAAHVDHGLRGRESRADARWVRELCRGEGVDCQVVPAEPVPDSLAGESVEGFLRGQRYRLLEAVARKAGARYLCTAHNANDQAETLVFRLLRGTGLDGLAGIPRVRLLEGGITLRRPLLDVPAHEIRAALRAAGQTWREDSSNRDEAFARNRIRHRILPMLQDTTPVNLIQSLGDLARSTRELQDELDQLVNPLLERCFRFEDSGFSIQAAGEGAGSPALWIEAIRRAWKRMNWPGQAMNRSRWNRIRSALGDLQSGRGFAAGQLPGGIRMSGECGRLVLRQVTPGAEDP